MKYKNYLLLITSFLILFACNNENPNDNNNDIDKNAKQLTATINNNKFVAKDIEFQRIFGTHYQILKILGIRDNDSIHFELTFQPDDPMKQVIYTIQKDGPIWGIYHHDNTIDTASEGRVFIESLEFKDTLVAVGTFNFKIFENNQVKYNITNGFFNSGNLK